MEEVGGTPRREGWRREMEKDETEGKSWKRPRWRGRRGKRQMPEAPVPRKQGLGWLQGEGARGPKCLRGEGDRLTTLGEGVARPWWPSLGWHRQGWVVSQPQAPCR